MTGSGASSTPEKGLLFTTSNNNNVFFKVFTISNDNNVMLFLLFTTSIYNNKQKHRTPYKYNKQSSWLIFEQAGFMEISNWLKVALFLKLSHENHKEKGKCYKEKIKLKRSWHHSNCENEKYETCMHMACVV